MKENTETFTSPIRRYVTGELQVSFDFAKDMKREIHTFETPKARYEVRIVECYLTPEEAAKDGTTLNKSQQLKLYSRSRSVNPKPTGLFRSSSWFEVYDIVNNKLDCCVENRQMYQGNADEMAEFLLELDEEHEYFSYCNIDWFEEPEIFEGYAEKSRPLHSGERNILDLLIREKLNTLYRT
jgi:hypothetical protein